MKDKLWNQKISGIALALLLLFSTYFSSLPLVSAAYTVEDPYMPPDLKGDFNLDGYVDGYDLQLFIKGYYSAYHPLYDLDDDGDIDGYDLQIFVKCYNANETEGPPIAYSTTFSSQFQKTETKKFGITS